MAHNCTGSKHEYEYYTFCEARVCYWCGDHAGLDRCGHCGWADRSTERPDRRSEFARGELTGSDQ